MSSSPRVAARRADVRERILDEAWELAREDGLAGLSLRGLAKRVGMQAPSLYGYFESKDAIYDGMFVRGYEQFEVGVGSVLEFDADLPELLAASARFFVGFCNDDPVRFQLLFQHAVPGWHPSPDAYAIAERVFGSMAVRMADHGITSPAAIDLWTAITSGLASQQVANDPGGDRWLLLVDDAVAMFLAAMPAAIPAAETPGPSRAARTASPSSTKTK